MKDNSSFDQAAVWCGRAPWSIPALEAFRMFISTRRTKQINLQPDTFDYPNNLGSLNRSFLALSGT